MVLRKTFGRKAKVELDVYSECKYTASDEAIENCKRVYYIIDSWDIVDGEDGDAIIKDTDGTCIDDYGEYLVLHLADGNESTFRNSYVDMFRIGWA